MPIYEYEIRMREGERSTAVYLHGILRKVSERLDPFEANVCPTTCGCGEDRKHTFNVVGPMPTADLPIGAAKQFVSRSLVYVRADASQSTMPKRPGMSGIDYGKRSWPAGKGNRIIPLGG